MRPLITFLFLILFMHCQLDPFNDGVKEVGKYRFRLVFGPDNKPIPGIGISIVTKGEIGCQPRQATSFAITDENGYFQSPKLEIGKNTYHEIQLFPDTIRWKNHLIVNNGYRNGGKEPNTLLELIPPTYVRLQVNFDTAQIQWAGVEFNYYELNYNANFKTYQSKYFNQSRSEAFFWFPELVSEIPLRYYSKKGVIQYKSIPIVPSHIDTLKITIDLP